MSVRRVRRGVFCTDPERDPSFEENVVAALLVLPPGSMSRGVTGARLWRLDGLLPASCDETLELLVPGRHNSVRLAGCRLRFDAITGVEYPAGIPTTTRPRTIVDVVASLPFEDGVVMVEAVMRGDVELHRQLLRESQRGLSARERIAVQRVLDFASPLSESVLESRSRLLCARAGLPPPLQQAVIRVNGRFLARVDFLWEKARLIVEVDGLAKYDDRGALQAEKERQNALIAAGYTVLRFTWADIMHRPDKVVAQIRAALAKVGM
jgi:hypothetical protein